MQGNIAHPSLSGSLVDECADNVGYHEGYDDVDQRANPVEVLPEEVHCLLAVVKLSVFFPNNVFDYKLFHQVDQVALADPSRMEVVVALPAHGYDSVGFVHSSSAEDMMCVGCGTYTVLAVEAPHTPPFVPCESYL